MYPQYAADRHACELAPDAMATQPPIFDRTQYANRTPVVRIVASEETIATLKYGQIRPKGQRSVRHTSRTVKWQAEQRPLWSRHLCAWWPFAATLPMQQTPPTPQTRCLSQTTNGTDNELALRPDHHAPMQQEAH